MKRFDPRSINLEAQWVIVRIFFLKGFLPLILNGNVHFPDFVKIHFK